VLEPEIPAVARTAHAHAARPPAMRPFDHEDPALPARAA
jgi:hypothetical protein